MFPGRLDLSKRGSARVGLTGSGRAGDKAGGRSRAGGKPAGRVRRTGAGRRSRFVDHDGRRGGADVRATFRGRLGAGFRSRRRVRAAALILGALRRRSSTPGCSAPGVTLVFEDFGLPLKAPPPASSANNVATQGCSGAWRKRRRFPVVPGRPYMGGAATRRWRRLTTTCARCEAWMLC